MPPLWLKESALGADKLTRLRDAWEERQCNPLGLAITHFREVEAFKRRHEMMPFLTAGTGGMGSPCVQGFGGEYSGHYQRPKARMP